MLYRTHIAVGLAVATGLIAAEITPMPTFTGNETLNIAIFLFVVAFGALLPDIDHANSYISNKLFPLPLKHRGITHTIYPWIALILLSGNYSGWESAAMFWVGVGALTHIFGDIQTKGGVKIFGFGPSIQILGPLTMRTGGVVEFFVFLGYSAISTIGIYLLPY